MLHEKLRELMALPSVGDVRGRGLLAGVEFVEDKETRQPFPASLHVADVFAANALELGLTVWPNAGHLADGTGDLAMLAPPFIIEEHQMDEMVALFGQAVERTLAHARVAR
jgi:adenosylmethionine-8-amino-7-oxononanoate aminotransferase